MNKHCSSGMCMLHMCEGLEARQNETDVGKRGKHPEPPVRSIARSSQGLQLLLGRDMIMNPGDHAQDMPSLWQRLPQARAPPHECLLQRT